jgi:hypothetical protein
MGIQISPLRLLHDNILSAQPSRSPLTVHSASALVPAELTSIPSIPEKTSSAEGLRRRFIPQMNRIFVMQQPRSRKHYPCAVGSFGTGLASHFQPSLPWVPSQNGRFDDMPQRQSEIAGFPVKSHACPFTSTSVIGPSTRNGPFGRTVIFTDSSDIVAFLSLVLGDGFSIAKPQQPRAEPTNATTQRALTPTVEYDPTAPD